MERNNKKTWDWIGIIGILIIIAGGVLVYMQSRACSNPLQTIIEQVNEGQGNLNYSYVIIEFHDGEKPLPIMTYKVYFNGSVEAIQSFYYNKDPFKVFGVPSSED